MKFKKTLPKNFTEIIESGDINAMKAVFDKCEINACGKNGGNALHFRIPDEFAEWLVDMRADINFRDNYKYTPLCSQIIYYGNIELYIRLGADIRVTDCRDRNVLHIAAANFRTDAFKLLLEHIRSKYPSDISSFAEGKDDVGDTPLELMLSVCKSLYIADAEKISEMLIDSGAVITRECRKSVTRIGKEFEFYRSVFNKEKLPETDAALKRLYRLFDVPPVPEIVKDDGGLITVKSETWQERHSELWEKLVPPNGPADTVQGEIIRVTGRISYEILDNGGANWDNDFKKMLSAVLDYAKTGKQLPGEHIIRMSEAAGALKKGIDSRAPEILCEEAVNWVMLNPNPIKLEKPSYKR